MTKRISMILASAVLAAGFVPALSSAAHAAQHDRTVKVGKADNTVVFDTNGVRRTPRY